MNRWSHTDCASVVAGEDLPIVAWYLRVKGVLVWTAPRHRVPKLGCQNTNKRRSVMELTLLAIDTSKHVFTLHGVDANGKAALRREVRRGQMEPFFGKLPPTEIALEACGGSHHWGRELGKLGHRVRLRPPQYVKPFVKHGTNDRIDAEAIAEAALRPNIKPVPVKSAETQAQTMVLSGRELLIRQQTQLVNAVRGHAAEFGVIAAKGITNVEKLLARIADVPAVPDVARAMFVELGKAIAAVRVRVSQLDRELDRQHKANALSQQLAAVPGIGPVTALTLAVGIDPAQFQSGRHFAAWIWLTPKGHSTGGKHRMGGSRARATNGCASC